MNFEEGEVILIDKPVNWTSFDAVKKIKGALGIRKIGHAGTLDPLATGLLILCTGKMTKQIEKFQGQKKTYIGEFLLGKTTPSFDLETEFDAEYDISHITDDLIQKTVSRFIGEIEQVPPVYSAVKVDGERLYKKARKGEFVVPKTRNVFIEKFKITAVNLPTVNFEVVCSKGTYIRSLAYDFGKALGAGAVLSSLRRTKIGEYSVENALSPEDFIRKVQEKRGNEMPQEESKSFKNARN